MWVAFGVMLVTMISMACCTNVRRKMPMNFIFLGLFTLAQSFLLGTISARYNVQEVKNRKIKFCDSLHFLICFSFRIRF